MSSGSVAGCRAGIRRAASCSHGAPFPHAHLHGVVADIRQRDPCGAARHSRAGSHSCAAVPSARALSARAGACPPHRTTPRTCSFGPIFEQLQMRRVVVDVRLQLVGSPRAFCLVALDLLGSGPAFRRPQHDHRPARPERHLRRPRFTAALLESRPPPRPASPPSSGAHDIRITAFDEVGL